MLNRPSDGAKAREEVRQMAGNPLRAAAVLVLLALASLACSAAAPASGPVDGQNSGVPVPYSGGTGDDGEQPSALRDGAYIVRTGNLRLELTDLAPALNQAQALIIGLGGYISGSEERNDASATYAVMTYRIPVGQWDHALAGLRALGQRVISENTQAADVTGEVVDLDARLANLRTTEAALQAIMDRATTIDDVLKVQRELTNTRATIESLTAQRDGLADRATYATITVSYEVRNTAVTVASEGWDLAREVDLAVASLVTILQRLASVAVWLIIVVLPVVLPFVLIGLIWWRINRNRQNRVTMGPNEPLR
jgi:hypothetical protein